MPGARDDYLLRMIQQVAAALRRLRGRVEDGAPSDEITRDAGGAIGELLGPQRAIMEMLDAKSAASLAGDAERLDLWVGLIRLQSHAAREAEDEVKASKLSARADALEAARPVQPQ
ncbi:MAG: hypothetical protein H7Z40_12935 [Phycisphaerae bacterium]|nr:hypothetical protein [Gemmatimonadaceae bacterium]